MKVIRRWAEQDSNLQPSLRRTRRSPAAGRGNDQAVPVESLKNRYA
jgi:hypothetical protein